MKLEDGKLEEQAIAEDTAKEQEFTPLVIPPGPFRAFLFDMDGTVADSMPLHYKSWLQAVREEGGDFPLDLFYSWGGLTLPRTVELLNERFGYHLDPVATSRRKEELYLELLPQIKPVPSVVAVMHAYHGKLPFAIVSGSPRASIVGTLERLGLLDQFDVLVGAEDYTHGKPNPEPFLNAAHKLGVPPESCLVFEDAEAGVASAKAAGMQYVKIPVPKLDPALLAL